VTLTPSRRPTSAASSCWRRTGPQSTSIWLPALSTRIDERRQALRGSAGSHLPHSLPILGTPVEVPQPRILSFTRCLAEKLEEIGCSRLCQRARILSPQLSYKAGGVGDERGLALAPPVRHWRQERGIRLHEHLIR